MSQEGGAAPVSLGAQAAGGSAELLRFIRQGRSFSGREPHCFFLNTRDGRFADLSAAANLNLDDDGRAVGMVDWDHDGDQDMWITNRNGPQLRVITNNLPQNDSTRFLLVRLIGEKCNRDAIGARLTLIDDRGLTQSRTVRAGDGYLSQSSKWIHFGLGNAESLSSLKINWPDGSVTTHANLQCNTRYVISQTNGATPVKANRQMLADVGELPSIEPSDTSRLLSISSVPVPKLVFREFGGGERPVFTGRLARPLLVNLFATWCQPCLEELADLSRNQDRITAADLDIVALCVDPLDPDSDVKDGQIQAVLQKIDFPYAAGIATERLVESLQLLNNHLFDLHLRLPVPMSILVDRDGKLVAMYKGSVSIDQILADRRLADKPIKERRAASTPYPGRWFEPINRTSHVPLLDALVANDLLEEADDFVRRIGEARKSNLLPAIVRLGMKFYRRGDTKKAQEHLGVVPRMEPSYVGAELNMAIQREKEGNLQEAIRLYRQALQRNPQDASVLNNYAWLLATAKDGSLRNGRLAVQLATRAAERTQLKNPSILGTLAAAYAENNEFDQALLTIDKAIEIAKEQSKLSLVKELRNQKSNYSQKRPLSSNR